MFVDWVLVANDGYTKIYVPCCWFIVVISLKRCCGVKSVSDSVSAFINVHSLGYHVRAGISKRTTIYNLDMFCTT